MHCYPQIIDQLMGRSEILRKGVTRAQIKEAIWFHRSGINLKKPVCSCGLIHNDAAREMHTNTMEQSSCPPPKDSFAEAALDLKPVRLAAQSYMHLCPALKRLSTGVGDHRSGSQRDCEERYLLETFKSDTDESQENLHKAASHSVRWSWPTYA